MCLIIVKHRPMGNVVSLLLILLILFLKCNSALFVLHMLVVSLLNDYSVDRCSLFTVVLLSFIATSSSYRRYYTTVVRYEELRYPTSYRHCSIRRMAGPVTKTRNANKNGG